MIYILPMIIGFILLSNPIFINIDILPDFIGYLLLILALYKTSCFTEKLSIAKRSFLKLLIVELFRIPALVIQQSSRSDNTMPLLIATAFGIIELIFAIPAFINFYDGILDSANGYEDSGMTEVFIKKNNFMKKFTIVFLIVRVVATVIPELTELELFEYYGNVSTNTRSLSSFKPFLYTVFIFIVIILAIIFIIKLIRFSLFIHNNKSFVSTLENRYTTEILPRKSYVIARRMRVILIITGIAVLFSASLIIDDINIMPYVLSGTILLVSLILIIKYEKKILVTIPINIAAMILSVVSFILTIKYFEYKALTTIKYTEEAMNEFAVMSTVYLIEHIIALAAIVIYIIYLRRICIKHTESFIDFRYKGSNAQIDTKAKKAEIIRTVNLCTTTIAISSAVKFIIDGIYFYLAAYTDFGPPLSILVSIVVITIVIRCLYVIYSKVYEDEYIIA